VQKFGGKRDADIDNPGHFVAPLLFQVGIIAEVVDVARWGEMVDFHAELLCENLCRTVVLKSDGSNCSGLKPEPPTVTYLSHTEATFIASVWPAPVTVAC
jgi:hypothetical protein